MVLKRFDDYWGDATKTETVNVQFFEETAQLKNALDNGEIDLNVNDLGPTERNALADWSPRSRVRAPASATS